MIFDKYGLNLADQLLVSGSVWVYRPECEKAPCLLALGGRARKMGVLEQRAREKFTGLWGQPNPMPPWRRGELT